MFIHRIFVDCLCLPVSNKITYHFGWSKSLGILENDLEPGTWCPKDDVFVFAGNHHFEVQFIFIFFHSFLCIFPRYFKGESLGKASTSIKRGESMGIPRLVKPEVKRPSVMPVKAGPDRSDFHENKSAGFSL